MSENLTTTKEINIGSIQSANPQYFHKQLKFLIQKLITIEGRQLYYVLPFHTTDRFFTTGDISVISPVSNWEKLHFLNIRIDSPFNMSVPMGLFVTQNAFDREILTLSPDEMKNIEDQINNGDPKLIPIAFHNDVYMQLTQFQSNLLRTIMNQDPVVF